MRRIRLWVVSACLLSLAAGFVAGYRTAHRTDGPPDPYLRRLAEEYDLRRDQIEAVAELLGEEDRRIETLLRSVAGEVSSEIGRIRKETTEAIRAVLDEEQRRRFDAAAGRP